MKAIGEKCGWVIPRKERRVLKLLRTHTRECEERFVRESPIVAKSKSPLRIVVQFAEEASSAFEPNVEIWKNPKGCRAVELAGLIVTQTPSGSSTRVQRKSRAHWARPRRRGFGASGLALIKISCAGNHVDITLKCDRAG